MSYNHLIGKSRGQNHVNMATTQRIESADGSRWAYARNRKLRLGGGNYSTVESWVIKHRVDGKVVTVHTDAYEAAARAFVGV